LQIKQKHNLSDQAFQDISNIFTDNKTSLYIAKKKLSKLINIKPIYIDMCINSCCAFTGEFSNNISCNFCGELRYITNNNNSRKKISRKQFSFIPLINRFKIQYNDSNRSKSLRYRYQYVTSDEYDDNNISDIFDGNLYKELVDEGYFNDERDIALIGSTDGFQIFKQKTDDCWVVMFINANLNPIERVKKENLLISLIIPGPNQPKYFNSFLRSLVNELKLLEGNI